MIIKTKALVVKEYVVGESDKYVTLLTKDFGKLQALAPRAKKYDKGFATGTQLFVYGEFMLAGHKNTYRLMNVEVLNMFHDLRNDLSALSYGSYILEFAAEVTQEGLNNEELLMLTLLTLHACIHRKEELKLIRRIFELRSLSILGFMPQLQRCAECSAVPCFDQKQYYKFVAEAGGIVCDECIESHLSYLKIGYSTLYTMQYIISSPLKEIFKFKISQLVLNELEKVCNQYLDYYIDKKFKTLDFINQIDYLI